MWWSLRREQERNGCTGSPQSVRLCGWSDTQTCLPEFCRLMLPLPVLHGCTIGELAQSDKRGRMDCQQEKSLFIKGNSNDRMEHGAPYSLPIKPSPNLPNDQSIRLYASLCPFEATRVSVGRGTTFLSKYWAHQIRNTEVSLLLPAPYPVLTKIRCTKVSPVMGKISGI